MYDEELRIENSYLCVRLKNLIGEYDILNPGLIYKLYKNMKYQLNVNKHFNLSKCNNNELNLLTMFAYNINKDIYSMDYS